MSLITFDGSVLVNPFLSDTSHIELSHPTISDRLLFAESTDKPYEHYPSGWAKSNGRNLLGAIKIDGGFWLKDTWECNFLASYSQVDLFNQLLQLQQTNGSVALADRWISDYPNNKTVWIDVDRQYLSLVAANSWFRLQFTLLEV